MATVGRGADQYTVRFPDGLRDRVKEAAEANGRSMNAEIVQVLLDHYLSGIDDLPPEMKKRVEDGESPLKVWRVHKGLSLLDLSVATGIDPANIKKIEETKRFGSVATLQAISEALGVSIDALI
ncbi:Arc family DNA-binding protein [Salipiger thiooxidans]|uniref:Arc family DNA-binding protein n=1 Tax=Salipiger thiooxidans TaxID=282683 RepID=UPI001A90CB62|nr:Arc family DNA-binding protein [Salipiger thiooxidans]MBN8189545.1 Arc family DNA-binding protein [Salipiger thiooxidans]